MKDRLWHGCRSRAYRDVFTACLSCLVQISGPPTSSQRDAWLSVGRVQLALCRWRLGHLDEESSDRQVLFGRESADRIGRQVGGWHHVLELALCQEGRSERCSSQVDRGGSAWNDPRNLRSANRDRNEPENRNDNQGFRCLRVPGRQRTAARRCAGPAPAGAAPGQSGPARSGRPNGRRSGRAFPCTRRAHCPPCAGFPPAVSAA
jgi:hypothetical protein